MVAVDESPAERGAPAEIAVECIVPNPWQPRQTFDEEGMAALAESIRQHGLVQPLVVQKAGPGRYELIAGERRLRAAKRCGLKTVPVLVRSYAPDEAAEIALIENLQREDLDAIEEGTAYARLIEDFGLTQAEAAAKVGKSRSHVANMIRLLQLPDDIKGWIAEGRLSMGQARPLLQLPAAKLQREAAVHIMKYELSARKAEALVRRLMAEKRPEKDADAHVALLQDRLKMSLGTDVSIHLGAGGQKGKIEIAFTSEAEFERLLSLLTEEKEAPSPPSFSSFHI
ncbi:ParB/RepB/Spo0J family partition protein [uncultured Megasphaera sp.]|uniref:ParB/RepB/Spo0J family partition protein n=1 Tax=uncultured Megasphaera sp. TaxID=165188 RepID=UPI002805FD23|nr:ParB/RepB/Spo0J family partition protein [uncultured Megasphaera sp.]